MGLMDGLDQIKPSEPGPPCGISPILDSLSESDRDALNAVLFEPKPRVHPHRDLQKFLISKGYNVSYSSVSLHRLKQCRCFTGKAARMNATAS